GTFPWTQTPDVLPGVLLQARDRIVAIAPRAMPSETATLRSSRHRVCRGGRGGPRKNGRIVAYQIPSALLRRSMLMAEVSLVQHSVFSRSRCSPLRVRV